jgi:menaquinone-specific isochorismate synthase
VTPGPATGGTHPTATLVARRLPLDAGSGPGHAPALDPFALAGSTGIVFDVGGRTLVGLGTAALVTMGDGLEGLGGSGVESGPNRPGVGSDPVTRALSAIDLDDRFDPGSAGLFAFGALPFDRAAPASMTIPAVTLGVEPDGRAWITVVAADHSTLPGGTEDIRAWLSDRAGPPPAPAPASSRGSGEQGRPAVVPRSTDEEFLAMVEEALAAIDRGVVAKVVLARQVDVSVPSAVPVPPLLRRWRELEPNCAVFSMPTPDGQMVGASPELLIERDGDRIRSRPLAGTTDRSVGTEGSVLPRELLRSAKDAGEHRLVVEAIETALAPRCASLEVPDHPDLVHLHSIVHLGTSVTGTLTPGPDGATATALELVAALHPTPAVAGVPREAACDLIGRLEPFRRGTYAGPVGYVDARGDGTFMVGIRAVSIGDGVVRLTAGVGIVAGSEPRTELAETDLKLRAVFGALAPGHPFTTAPGDAPRERAVS